MLATPTRLNIAEAAGFKGPMMPRFLTYVNWHHDATIESSQAFCLELLSVDLPLSAKMHAGHSKSALLVCQPWGLTRGAATARIRHRIASSASFSCTCCNISTTRVRKSRWILASHWQPMHQNLISANTFGQTTARVSTGGQLVETTGLKKFLDNTNHSGLARFPIVQGQMQTTV